MRLMVFLHKCRRRFIVSWEAFRLRSIRNVIKEYAQGNVMGMMGLAYRGMKFSFFLLLFIAYPLVLEMDFILSRWLGTVPELAPAFL